MGHPPFGHVAEHELNELALRYGGVSAEGFEGSAQSFRILTSLASHRRSHQGLNLTRATLNAVLKYPWRKECVDIARKEHRKYSYYHSVDKGAFDWVRVGSEGKIASPEAQIMDIADALAYSIHDFADFYQAGLIPLELLASSQGAFSDFLDAWKKDDEGNKHLRVISGNRRRYVNLLQSLSLGGAGYLGTYEHIAAVQTQMSAVIQKYFQLIELREEPPYVDFRSADTWTDLKLLQRMVWHYVIRGAGLGTQQYSQRYVIRTLFDVYRSALADGRSELRQIPRRFHHRLSSLENDAERVRLSVDIVASLSDNEAVAMFRRFRGVSTSSVVDLLPQ